MFTGIIQAIGKVREPEKLGNGVRLTISAPDLGLDQVGIGESIAVTVVEKGDDWFRIDVSAESLSKTAGLDTFGPVNLEKAMRLGDRVDGHLVSGHVDGIGQVVSLEQVAESYKLVILAPRKLAPCIAYKGSIAVNGVSLTINEVEDTSVGPRFSINLIPHTMEVTTLHFLKAQSLVNLEVDLIARYVQRNMELREGDDIL